MIITELTFNASSVKLASLIGRFDFLDRDSYFSELYLKTTLKLLLHALVPLTLVHNSSLFEE